MIPIFEPFITNLEKQYSEFIVFTEGIRGGVDYEKDTYRVSDSIIDYNHK